MSYDMYSDIDSYDMLDEQYSDDGEDENMTETVSELLELCIKPTVLQTYGKLFYLFIICILFRVVTHFPKHNYYMFNATSILGGVYVLYVFFGAKCLNTVGLVVFGFAIIYFISLLSDKNYKGYIVGVIILLYLFVGEFFIFKYDTWSSIRGSQMLASMKIFSYAFDTDSGLIKEIKFLDFCGYILCPANCVFGPWVSYSDYVKLKYNDLWDVKWLLKITYSFLLSLFFFVTSVCLLEWLISDDSNMVWLVYRNAMLFRLGHYFVSYISEVSSVLSGFGGSKWDFVVTKPQSIELPYSLVQVVVCWNIPMHRWLKTYVFKTTIHLGSFMAVMLTYFVSSLLHGFNLRIAAVLLSLGIYTYVEHRFRDCLGKIFNACITSKPCVAYCKRHKRTTRNLIVHTVNLFFIAVAIFHLAYLGVLMEVNNNKTLIKDTFKEWENLHYVSHWSILATFVVYLLIEVLS